MVNKQEASQPAQPDSRHQFDLELQVAELMAQNAQLKQQVSDLHIALSTTAEHGDAIEAELHHANQRLRYEVDERTRAQSTLQTILETVSRDKSDLELMLQATAEHGDILEYQLYTQAVETMRRSEELFRAISESTSVLMILTQEPDGAIAYANSVSGSCLGLAVSQLLGQSLQTYFANPADHQLMQHLLHQQGFVHNYEIQVRRADGALLWVSASAQPLRLAERATVLTTLYDISDRKQAEAALRASEDALRQQTLELEQRVEQRTDQLRQAEAMYRSIFENAVEGIFQLSAQGQFLAANPALARLYGYDSPEELIATVAQVGQQVYVQPRRWDELSAYLKGFDEVEDFESQVQRKDGRVLWVSENVRVVKDIAGRLQHYEGSVRDITDRKATEAELHKQRIRSERLLLNVLPQAVAERLKRGETRIADSFSRATVLFADIANFTHLSAQISPRELIDLLNNVFSAFDHLADRYNLEKIKTIGDAYMVVGGIPSPTPEHEAAVAHMALGMQRAIAQFKTPEEQPITLRVGIHTGPVVAGVIGTRKFTYDLWGDTVNVASRMELQGEPGRIQVTAPVYERLSDRFEFLSRGPIEIRGKGTMHTYWLMQARPEEG
ncbi:MAG: PAS domain S-box protein [Kaiparowitsia implicata GSE-PSE-MK54-09C]|jgi:PAS domain S-box-containing protein|nr:PAS domain S-box protein [Kaiparowitsia implicata GSE-PSE-MK54-09C]